MSISQRVREQYELYPYPPRDPEDERKRLIQTNLETIEVINHYCFRGQNPFIEGGDILVAGGGTGDAAIYLAEQLRDTPSKVWYLDVSQSTAEIARHRAKVRGLTNIEWLVGSIFDLPELVHYRKFQFIDCCGVLHHLEQPEKALRILADCLSDDGAMCLMVYALYGRSEIYRIQDLARRIIFGPSLGDWFVELKRLLAALPDGHPYRAYIDEPDAGLCDAFLHAQDRAYTVPQLYHFLGSADLDLATFAPGWRHLYDPEKYLPDWDWRGYTTREKQAIGELLSGNISQHVFLATKQDKTEADPVDSELMPVIPERLGNPKMFGGLPDEGEWQFHSEKLPDLTLNPDPAVRVACRLIDGKRSIREIAPRPEVRREFLDTIRRMREWADVPVFKSEKA